MKKVILLFIVLFLLNRCITDDLSGHKPYQITMNFSDGNDDKTITVLFTYSKSQQRYVPHSNQITEIKAIHEVTREEMFVYLLKTEYEKQLTNARYEIKTGYVGYSQITGCYYWGTMHIGDNGESLFVPATGINAILNPPICNYWYV